MPKRYARKKRTFKKRAKKWYRRNKPKNTVLGLTRYFKHKLTSVIPLIASQGIDMTSVAVFARYDYEGLFPGSI